MPANPFRFNNHVDPNKFIGRNHLVEQIINDLYTLSGDSYGIVGGRRFGKSSLLRAIEHELLKGILALETDEKIDESEEKEIVVLPVFISLKSLNLTSPDDVFGLILHRLRKAVCGQKKPIPLFPGPTLELGLPDYKLYFPLSEG